VVKLGWVTWRDVLRSRLCNSVTFLWNWLHEWVLTLDQRYVCIWFRTLTFFALKGLTVTIIILF
jgi:hypothetical protein